MEFRLLGPVEAVDDGRPLGLGGRRQRAVLTHLLLRRDTAVSRDALVDLVWGEDPPRAVAASLHSYVSRLRGVLGPARLETRSGGYVLHAEPEELDAVWFEAHLARARADAAEDPATAVERYVRALQLWRGPALGDLADEPSLAPDAARLDGLRDRAVEEHLALRLACGDHAALVPELTDLVERWPLREDLWGHLVLALYRSGRQAEALAALESVRRHLDDELGVAPGPALRRLHEQVLRQDLALTPAGEVLHGYVLCEQVGRGPTSVVHRAVQPVVGREVALKLLHRSVSDAPELVQRFAASASSAAAVEHPHVLPLHDCWRGPGGAVLVLRLLHGGTLGDLLRAGQSDVADVLHLLEQVGAALDACWQQGVVHRHLEPDDVLLDAHGHAYVGSFVLARELARGRDDASGPDGRPDVHALARLLRVVVPGSAVDPDGHGGQSLVAAVRAAVAPAVPGRRPPAPLERPRNPYKGLRPFTEADAGDFAGRTALVARLLQRLTTEDLRFLAVVGPSGAGKSSVVRAGLVPALRQDTATWYVLELVPGAAPFEAVETALRRVAVRPLLPGTAGDLRADPGRLPGVVDRVLPQGDDRARVLLVVDQLEELFALVDDLDERHAFLDLLARAATAADGRLRVVVTLRADFYDRPLTHPALAALVQAGTEVVVPLTAEELEQAVVDPAERVGLQVEPALLAQVVADVGHAPGALPLLQYALTELAEAAEDGVLSLAGYRAVGGVAGALLQRADGLHERSTEHERAITRQLLLQLVDPSDSGAGLRRRVRQDELVSRTDDPETAAGVVTAYGAARLLAFDRDPATRAPTVEVAHEALLQQWSVLRGWLEAAHDDLRAAQRWATAAREWDETGRDPSFLATGARLAALEQWSVRSSAAAAGTLERDLLAASLRARDDAEEQEQDRVQARRTAQRREVRRLRAVAAVLAVAVAAATALAVFGLQQQDRAEREAVLSDARALAAAAAASLAEDPERAVLLALRAVEATRAPDGSALPEAVETLHRAVVADRVVLTLQGTGGAADWSSKGLLVTEGAEGSGTVELRRAATGEPVRAWRSHDDVNAVVFSPDGRRLLTTGDDGAARLWDVATGQQVWAQVTTGQVWGPSFDRSGRLASAAWQDEGVVRVLDAASGAVRSSVRAVARPEASALLPDGRRVVVAGRRSPGALVADARTGATLLRLAGDGAGTLDVAVSPDGRRLATARVGGGTVLWDLADGRSRGTLLGGALVADLDWSPDGHRVVAGGDDGVARVLALDDGALREGLRLSSSELHGVTGAAFSPTGEQVLLGDGRTVRSQVWDITAAGSREWLTLPAPLLRAVGADFTGDGDQLVASAPGGAAAVVDVGSGRVLRRTPAHPGVVAGVRVSPDGRRVAGVVGGALRVWDVTTAAQVLEAPTAAPLAPPEWRSDGRQLALATDRGLLLVGVPDGEVVAPEAPDAVAAAYTPDGQRLVTAHTASAGLPSGRVDVHDVSTWRLTDRWHADVVALAVTADGRSLVAAHAGGDIAVRDLASGATAATLVGHVGRVLDLAPSPDGTRLASAGRDGSVRLWDLSSGTQELRLPGHDSAVATVRWSPDGQRLVTSSWDGTVRVWAVALADLVELARQRVSRSLSDDECRRHLQQRRCQRAG